MLAKNEFYSPETVAKGHVIFGFYACTCILLHHTFFSNGFVFHRDGKQKIFKQNFVEINEQDYCKMKRNAKTRLKIGVDSKQTGNSPVSRRGKQKLTSDPEGQTSAGQSDMSTASPKNKIAKRRKIPSRRVLKSTTKSSPERETVEQSENNNATPQSADENERVEAVLQKEQDVTLNEITDVEFESEGI